MIGKGGFCSVYEVLSVTNETFDELLDKKGEDKGSISHSKTCTKRFAIKMLSKELYDTSNPEHFVMGVVDFAMEVKFLNVLKHVNIIKMWATTAAKAPFSKDFFIVLDRLECTLEDKIGQWKDKKTEYLMAKRRRRGSHQDGGLQDDDNNNQKDTFLCERLKACHDVCAALTYMHENK